MEKEAGRICSSGRHRPPVPRTERTRSDLHGIKAVAALKEGVKPVVSPNSRALPPDEPTDARKAALLGLGLDGDGQVRITRGENFLLLGGSQTTHEEMQDTA